MVPSTAGLRLKWQTSPWAHEKLDDQRVPVIGYKRIKDLRSLNMNYYLVTGGLLSIVEPSSGVNQLCQQFPNWLALFPNLVRIEKQKQTKRDC